MRLKGVNVIVQLVDDDGEDYSASVFIPEAPVLTRDRVTELQIAVPVLYDIAARAWGRAYIRNMHAEDYASNRHLHIKADEHTEKLAAELRTVWAPRGKRVFLRKPGGQQ